VCTPALASLSQQIQNPVGMFAQDNNGVIIELPSLPPSGAPGASGSITFGIGTQSNNAVGSALVIPVDPSGNFSTVLSNTTTYGNSFIDSGSNALFFADPSIPNCAVHTGFYCPNPAANLSATNQGPGGAVSMVNFQVANTDALNPSNFAFSNIAGTNSDATSFDWGLPFFYGRRVLTAIEGQATSAGFGPYVAY
jgi:hypothetical protein